MNNVTEIKIERVIMSGKGPRITYKLVLNSKTMFQTSSNSYIAWTRKKDSKLIIERIRITFCGRQIKSKSLFIDNN
jgi:hypothetical protein